MEKAILLASEREEDFVFAAEIARRCGGEIVLFSDVDKIVEHVGREGSPQGIFVGFSDIEGVKSFSAKTKGKLETDRVHAIVSPSDSDTSMAAFRCDEIGNFVLNRYSNPIQDGAYYSRVVKAIDQDRSFGLKSVLNASGGVQTVKLTDSYQKGFAANAVAFHLRELRCNERIARTVAGAVDELLMNAIFDAPVNEKGQRIYDRTPRGVSISTVGVELQIGLEEELIAVMVKDQSGSLNRTIALDHIAKTFDLQRNHIRGEDYQGAGIGLALVIRSGGSLFFVNEPGKQTEVTVFFRQTEKFKDFKNPFQFVATRIYNRK